MKALALYHIVAIPDDIIFLFELFLFIKEGIPKINFYNSIRCCKIFSVITSS